MDPIATARYGLMAASHRFETAATQIAGAPADAAADPVAPMVDMIQAKHAFEANLTVVKFSQDMWDSLLNMQSK